ncbi:hypothetical protein [Streptomyces mirabilis]|uniref:hypothetical protein n=1 Tax=Streptomyces mirabilis TaxID=68239 RepID=UPI003250DD05
MNAHQHFDFRFLFRTGNAIVELQEAEVTDYAWQFADTFTTEPLRGRILTLISQGSACYAHVAPHRDPAEG